MITLPDITHFSRSSGVSMCCDRPDACDELDLICNTNYIRPSSKPLHTKRTWRHC